MQHQAVVVMQLQRSTIGTQTVPVESEMHIEERSLPQLTGQCDSNKLVVSPGSQDEAEVSG